MKKKKKDKVHDHLSVLSAGLYDPEIFKNKNIFELRELLDKALNRPDINFAYIRYELRRDGEQLKIKPLNLYTDLIITHRLKIPPRLAHTIGKKYYHEDGRIFEEEEDGKFFVTIPMEKKFTS